MLAIVKDGAQIERPPTAMVIVLTNQTPFYAESGGGPITAMCAAWTQEGLEFAGETTYRSERAPAMRI